MKLRRLSFIWGIALSLFVLAGDALFSTYIIDEGFSEIEKRHVLEELRAAHNGIDSSLKQLSLFTWDWSTWDDTYTYAQDKNALYEESNLGDTTFIDQQLTAIVIRNTGGDVVYSHAVDDEGMSAPDLKAALLHILENNFSRLIGEDDEQSGLARVGKSFYLIATRPILTSDGTGPPMGTLTMVRQLSAGIVETISNNVGFPVTIIPQETRREIANLIITANGTPIVHNTDKQTAIGARFLETVNKGKSGLITIEVERMITQYGRKVEFYNAAVILISIFLLAVTTYTLLHRKILRRLEKIDSEVSEIRQEPAREAFVEVSGDDEISDLSNSINMLLGKEREAHRASLAHTQQIADNELFLTQVLNSISVGILLVDPESREIVHANDFVLKMAQREREEVIGHVCHRLTCPAELNNCPILDKHQSHDLSKRKLLTRDGGEVPIMKSVSYVDRNGRELLLETIIDITEIEQSRRELERVKEGLEETVAERTRELKEANMDLVALDKAKTLFLSSASHELRTPLTSIMGFLKLMERKFKKHFYQQLATDSELRPQVDKFVDNIKVVRSEAERLGRLVNDLLSLNKIESGRMEWRDEDLDVRAIIEHAAESFYGQAEAKARVDLIVEQPREALRIHADRDRIQQVLINLLNNSFKFTESGYVSLAASDLGDAVAFSVSDTGKGISELDRAQIFDLFYQVHDENKRSSKEFGTGLGLAICRQIVTHYEGDIGVESVEGEGSTFTFTIPKA